jgi:hypothetical protein
VSVFDVRENRIGNIVQDVGLPLQEHCQDSVSDAPDAVLDHHDAQVVLGVAEFAQGKILDDGVILAISGNLQEFLGRGPPVRGSVGVLIQAVGPFVEKGVDRFSVVPCRVVLWPAA